MTGLELAGVRAAYGEEEVLRGIDLTAGCDELLVVLGPSGSGKSTLLRVIAGLEPATAGRVSIGGRDVTEVRPGARNVAMVFQSYALFPHLTARDNITFGLEVRDVPRAEAHARAAEAAVLAGCDGFLDRRPGQLAGGERQRVALARALARKPDVFLLDEPMSNLDAELRTQTRSELKALHTRLAVTMVHVTHDQVEALVLGDRVAVLRDGLLEQVGTPEEIWTSPATRFVARFVGSPAMNFLPADGPLRPAGIGHEDAAGLEVGVRPDALTLAVTRRSFGTPATVEQVELVGADAHVHLQMDGHRVVARVPAAARPAVGERCGVSAAPEHLHVFDRASGRRVQR